ncbi:NfeD family protein [Psychrobacter sp. FDAARGOS_221]|uniref:NfeD family protein n=1 Tax=Psychrobacter sp. FDAARGOS_221 TaxID=1975705 RepID=UPI000BB58BC9|nr:NfeD family protein [Psychrobacter sp. FDAARGOS_221]PNK60732.1 NfeD family protein [Psychrobacter sp. FDAARGOS_221]
MFVLEPWHWLALGGVLIISEMFLTTFATLWFGIAAVMVALLSWLFPIPEVFQVLLWLLFSILMVVMWFKYVKPLSIDRTKAGLGGSVIIGETGIITKVPTLDKVGTIRFSVPIVGATEWRCRTRGEPLELGERVVVIEIIGNELIVAPAKLPAHVEYR